MAPACARAGAGDVARSSWIRDSSFARAENSSRPDLNWLSNVFPAPAAKTRSGSPVGAVGHNVEDLSAMASVIAAVEGYGMETATMDSMMVKKAQAEPDPSRKNVGEIRVEIRKWIVVV